MIKWQWRFTRWFWIGLLLGAILLSNLSFSTTRVAAAVAADKNIMQARTFTWFGLPYVAQLKAHIVYDNGAGYYSGGTWHWTRRPRMWMPGSYLDCHMDGLIKQTLVGDGCGVTRISATKVDVYMIWRQEIKVLGVGMERTCWMRARIRIPDATVYWLRRGGEC